MHPWLCPSCTRPVVNTTAQVAREEDSDGWRVIKEYDRIFLPCGCTIRVVCDD